MLNITEIRINKINNGNFLGYASILIDKCLIVDGIELYNGKNGRYILMPLNSKIKKAKRNSAYPITNEAREYILDQISKQYDKDSEE